MTVKKVSSNYFAKRIFKFNCRLNLRTDPEGELKATQHGPNIMISVYLFLHKISELIPFHSDSDQIETRIAIRYWNI